MEKKNDLIFEIGQQKIGQGQPVFVIAEAGSNWRVSKNAQRNYQQALRLIDIAVLSKADAVKFQLFQVEKLYAKNISKSTFDIVKESELPSQWLKPLQQYCRAKNIIFLCTPFDEESVDELEKIDIGAYKIASSAISHLSFIDYVASKKKPTILSIGGSDEEDIARAVFTIKQAGNQNIALMQCTLQYPAPLSTLNLRVVSKMSKKFNLPVGLSDHSREPYIAPLGAVALGAKVIEKHFTIDNKLPGADHKFAILGDELIELVKQIRQMEASLGTSKKYIQKQEMGLHKFCRRKLYALKNIKKEEKLTKENVVVLRPGSEMAQAGLGAEKLSHVLGKKAKKDIKANTLIKKDAV